MNKQLSATDEQPPIIEIIETVDSPARQRLRRALIPARQIARQTIHLKSDEFAITPQKEPTDQPVSS